MMGDVAIAIVNSINIIFNMNNPSRCKPHIITYERLQSAICHLLWLNQKSPCN